MLTRIITTALFAGFCAGLIAAILQFLLVQPILLHAELFENRTLLHFGDSGAGTPAHGNWPGVDLLRDGLSLLFTVLVYTGYGFLLTAAIALAAERGVSITPRSGLIWGAAGFVAIQLAAASGLPPELPGAGTAQLDLRQIWWFGSAAATALGLWLIAFGTSPVTWTVAAIAIAAPHAIGAPQPDIFIGPAPPELAAHFAVRTLAVGLVSWSILGMLAGHFWNSMASHV